MEINKSPSIIIISSHPPYRKGGVETYGRQIILLSKKLRLDLKLLTYIPDNLKSFLVCKDKILWIKVPSPILHNIMLSHNFISKLDTPLRKMLFALLHWLFIMRGMLKYLSKLSKTYVIVSDGAFVEAMPTFLFSVLLRKKFFIIWHTSLANFVENAFVYILLKMVFSKACGVLVNGIDIAKYAKYLGAKRINLRMQDVDIHTFKPLNIYEVRDSLGIPHNAITVLFAAPLNESKMADIFIKAAELALQIDKTFMFIIIGEGPLSVYAEKLKQQYPNNVIFIHGFVSKEKLNEFFNASDIIFGHADSYYPARITLEALSAGRPVVLLNATVGNRKRRIHFRLPLPNVFIVNPTDKDLAKFLIEHKNEILKLSRNSKIIIESRNYIAKNYAYEKQLLRDIYIIIRSCLVEKNIT